MSSIYNGLSSWVSAGVEAVTALSNLTHSEAAVDVVKRIYSGIGSLVGKAVDKAGPTALTGMAASYHGYKGGDLLLKSRNGFAAAEKEAKEEIDRITYASGAIAHAKANCKHSSAHLETAQNKLKKANENYQRALVAVESTKLKVKRETTEQQLAAKNQKEQGKMMPWFTQQTKRLEVATDFIKSHFKSTEDTVKVTTSVGSSEQTRHRTRDDSMTTEHDAKALIADFSALDSTFFEYHAKQRKARRANHHAGPQLTEEQVAEKVALYKANGVYLNRAKAELATATANLNDAKTKWDTATQQEKEAFKHAYACSEAFDQANAQLDQIRTGKDLKKELSEQAAKDRNEGLISLGFAATEAIPILTGGTAVTSAVGGALSSVAGAALPPVAGAVVALATPIAVGECFSAGSSMIGQSLNSESTLGQVTYGLAGGVAVAAGGALATLASGAVGTAVAAAGAPIAVTTAATLATATLALTGGKVAKWACTNALSLSAHAGEAVLRAPSAAAAVTVGLLSRAGACALHCLSKSNNSAKSRAKPSNAKPQLPQVVRIAPNANSPAPAASKPSAGAAAAAAAPTSTSQPAQPRVPSGLSFTPPNKPALSAVASAVSQAASSVLPAPAANAAAAREGNSRDEKHSPTQATGTKSAEGSKPKQDAAADVKPTVAQQSAKAPIAAASEATDLPETTPTKAKATIGKTVKSGQVQQPKKRKKAPPKNQVPVTLTTSSTASFARTKAYRQHRANTGAPTRKTHRR
jgi:hypothetical protein